MNEQMNKELRVVAIKNITNIPPECAKMLHLPWVPWTSTRTFSCCTQCPNTTPEKKQNKLSAFPFAVSLTLLFCSVLFSSALVRSYARLPMQMDCGRINHKS